MKKCLVGAFVCLLFAAGCDNPDEVYQAPPDGYDTDVGNGLDDLNIHYTGTKGFDVEDRKPEDKGVPTIEVCTDEEVSANQTEMVGKPIIPMIGAGGLDMTGGEDWSGLTIDEVQTPEMLCQALYYGDGIAAFGDYFELILYFDMQTRKVDSMMVRPGYTGVLTAGEFRLEINESILRAGEVLNKTDGSALDARTDDVMRELDRALIREYRSSLDADQVDCVESGSCYIIMSGTEPVLVFMSVGIYIVLEPTEHRISNIQMSLKRPFRVGTGEAAVDGYTPSIKGTSVAGIPNCDVTWGTKWSHIDQNCLGPAGSKDPLAMAQITSAYSYQMIAVNMGGVMLFFDRPGAATEKPLPVEPTMQPDDTVSIVSINAAYEGDFAMPYSEILRIFKYNLETEIRDEQGIAETETIGVEMLVEPDAAGLSQEVKDRYPDRLRPGGIYAAFCENSGTDEAPVYDIEDCETSADGKPVLPLTSTLKKHVSAALGMLGKAKSKYTEPSFYVQHFERAIGDYMNGARIVDGAMTGTQLLDNQINFSPNSNRPDLIYVTISIKEGGERYVIQLYYGGNDDRIHFINFQRGVTAQEDVLLRDADIYSGEVFSFLGLRRSPDLGLGASGTITVKEVKPEYRRALIEFDVGGEASTVLAPYQEASSVTGYWVPLQGIQSVFRAADWFSLTGGMIGAGFYMAPVSKDSAKKEVVGVLGSSFYGTIPWCGQQVQIGDIASELLDTVVDEGYPCEMIVRRSENNEFITSIYDMSAQVSLSVTDDLVTNVFAWLR